MYNGEQRITIASTNSFTYTLPEIPEKTSYGSLSGLTYETDSSTAFGEISTFDIKNSGKNYYSLPGITTINSAEGTNAIISGVVGRVYVNSFVEPTVIVCVPLYKLSRMIT